MGLFAIALIVETLLQSLSSFSKESPVKIILYTGLGLLFPVILFVSTLYFFRRQRGNQYVVTESEVAVVRRGKIKKSIERNDIQMAISVTERYSSKNQSYSVYFPKKDSIESKNTDINKIMTVSHIIELEKTSENTSVTLRGKQKHLRKRALLEKNIRKRSFSYLDKDMAVSVVKAYNN